MNLGFICTYHILCECVNTGVGGVFSSYLEIRGFTVDKAKVVVSGESMRDGLAGTLQADPGSSPGVNKQTNKMAWPGRSGPSWGATPSLSRDGWESSIATPLPFPTSPQLNWKLCATSSQKQQVPQRS